MSLENCFGQAPTQMQWGVIPACALYGGLIACNMSIDRHQVGQSTATGLIIINDALFVSIAHDSQVKPLIVDYLRGNPNKPGLKPAEYTELSFCGLFR